jgi:hypothetical protein
VSILSDFCLKLEFGFYCCSCHFQAEAKPSAKDFSVFQFNSLFAFAVFAYAAVISPSLLPTIL